MLCDPGQNTAVADLRHDNSSQGSTRRGGCTQLHSVHILLSLGDVADLPNTQRQTQETAKMRRQRNTAQMKEQNKFPEKELNKMETSNLLDAEFKTLVIKMLNELSENLNSLKKI